jgi:RNA polymerase sigma-32 factor
MEDPAWMTADEEISNIRSAGLTEALQALDPRSREIVESRWLMDSKAGLKELSEKYGVSMERIRQIESKAFEKMQPYLEVAV